MKKRIIIILLAVFLVANVTAANTCTDPSQILYTLTADTNAHGSSVSGTNPTEVCYNQIFGDGSSPGNFNCNGNNAYLRLSDFNNAHAEGPNKNTEGYSNRCAENIENCRIETNSCTGGRSAIARLSTTFNAHISSPQTNTYNHIICCSSISSSPPQNCDPVCPSGQLCNAGTCQDDGNPVTGNCGNGIIEASEICDDGGIIPNDGCSATCNIENEWTCDGQNPTSCTPTTTPPPVESNGYWAQGDNDIPLANKAIVKINQIARLYAKNVPVGETVSFTIEDIDVIFHEEIGIVTAVADLTGIAFTEYTFSYLDFEHDTGNENELELEFTAITPSGYAANSENRLLLQREEDIPNDEPGCEVHTERTACEDSDGYVNNANDLGLDCDDLNINCDCNWNNNDDVCELRSIIIPPGEDLPFNFDREDDEHISCIGSCNVQSTRGVCLNGQRTITTRAAYGVEAGTDCNLFSSISNPTGEIIIATDQTSCQARNGQTQTVACGSGTDTLTLPLFGLHQFLLSAISITTLYLLMFAFDKKKRE